MNDWIKDGRLSDSVSLSTPESSDSVTQMSVGNRATLWRLGHERRLEGGSWGVDSSRTPETARVIERIVSILLI
jgi:hypothetical protein